jgi:hypothetical protein
VEYKWWAIFVQQSYKQELLPPDILCIKAVHKYYHVPWGSYGDKSMGPHKFEVPVSNKLNALINE